jgi:hypothetical protein
MPESYYAAAGLRKDGIVEKIGREMARKFPAVTASMPDCPEAIHVAYAYLEASVKYKIPFHENDKRLVFKASNGTKTSVKSFGIREKDQDSLMEMRGQVHVLFEDRFSFEEDEYALDLCRETQPYQVIVARLNKREDTLADTLRDVQEKIERGLGHRPSLFIYDVLLVPNILFTVSGGFPELERIISGLQTFQTIKFKLDRKGALLVSEARLMTVGGGGVSYAFDRPFLVLMKKRHWDRPFFVMWVDNAELLTTW